MCCIVSQWQPDDDRPYVSQLTLRATHPQGEPLEAHLGNEGWLHVIQQGLNAAAHQLTHNGVQRGPHLWTHPCMDR
jgi:hypothetical protein